MYLFENLFLEYPLQLFLILGAIIYCAYLAKTKKIKYVIVLLIAFISLILALSNPIIIYKKNTKINRKIILIDISSSISDKNLTNFIRETEKIIKNNKKVKIFSIAENLQLVNNKNLSLLVKIRGKHKSQKTKLGMAVENIASSIKSDENAEIIIFSDANSTDKNFVTNCKKIINNNIKIKIANFDNYKLNQTILKSAQVPSNCYVKVPLKIKLNIQTNERKNIKVVVKNNQEPNNIKYFSLKIKPEKQKYIINLKPKKIGVIAYTINIDDPLTLPITIATYAKKLPKVGILNINASDSFFKNTIKILKMSSVISNYINVQKESQLEECSLLIINNTQLSEIPHNVQKKILNNVKNGMGLLVFSDYLQKTNENQINNQIFNTLPVKFSQSKIEKDPAVALVLIIDTSGSMSNMRLNLAKEVARNAIDELKQHDMVGIVEFHGAKRWAAPLQSAKNTLTITRALNRLSAGGGTVIYPAIEEAFYSLRYLPAAKKHILVISDGGVENGDFEALVKKISSNKINLSTVCVGSSDRQNKFLMNLSQWGSGKFYFTPNYFSIPKLIFRQLKKKPKKMINNQNMKFEAVSLKAPLNKIIPYKSLELKNTLKCNLKDKALMLLRNSKNNKPIISTWQYGLGKSSFVASSLNNALKSDKLKESINNLMVFSILKNYDQGIISESNDNNFIFEENINFLFRKHFDKVTIGNKKKKNFFETKFSSTNNPLKYKIYKFSDGLNVLKFHNNNQKQATNFAFYIQDLPEINNLTPNTKTMNLINKLSDKISTEKIIKKYYFLRPILIIIAVTSYLLQLYLRRGLLEKIKFSKKAPLLLIISTVAINSQIVKAQSHEGLKQDINITVDLLQSKLNFNKLNWQKLMLDGFVHFKKKDFKKAQKLFLKANTITKNDQEKILALQLALNMEQNKINLRRLINKLLQKKDISFNERYLLLNILENEGFYTEAYNTLKNNFSSNINERFQYHEDFIRLGQKNKAFEEVEKFYAEQINTQPNIYNIAGFIKYKLMNDSSRKNITAFLNKVLSKKKFAPKELLELAQILMRYGLFKDAQKIVTKIRNTSKKADINVLHFNTLELLISININTGKIEKAKNNIEQYYLLGRNNNNANAILYAGKLYEKIYDFDKALNIYMKSFEQSNNPQFLYSAISLLELNKNYKEVQNLWLKILLLDISKNSKNQLNSINNIDYGSLKTQAVFRIISLCKKLKNQDNIIAKITKKYHNFTTKKINKNVLLILANLYLINKEHNKLDELLKAQQQFYNFEEFYSLKQQFFVTNALNQDAKRNILLAMKKFPKKRLFYLQQLAAFGIQINSKLLVKKSLQDISFLDKKGQLLAFRANVAAMIEDYKLTAKLYKQIITKDPNSLENYLLLTEAMVKNNQRQEAVKLLLSELNKNLGCNDYSIIIDGILNTNPSQKVIKYLFHKTLNKTADKLQQPQNHNNILLYSELLIDLAEKLLTKNKEQIIEYLNFYRAINFNTIRANELRVLMDNAISLKNTDNAIIYGRLYQAINKYTNPSFYFSFGEVLLKKGYFAEMEKLFPLTPGEENIYTKFQEQLAENFIEHQMLNKAQKIYRNLSLINYNDYKLQSKVGNFSELKYNFKNASEIYLKIYLKIIKQLPQINKQKKLKNIKNINSLLCTLEKELQQVTIFSEEEILSKIKSMITAEINFLNPKYAKKELKLNDCPRLNSMWSFYNKLLIISGKTNKNDLLLNQLEKLFKNDDNIIKRIHKLQKMYHISSSLKKAKKSISKRTQSLNKKLRITGKNIDKNILLKKYIEDKKSLNSRTKETEFLKFLANLIIKLNDEQIEKLSDKFINLKIINIQKDKRFNVLNQPDLFTNKSNPKLSLKLAEKLMSASDDSINLYPYLITAQANSQAFDELSFSLEEFFEKVIEEGKINFQTSFIIKKAVKNIAGNIKVRNLLKNYLKILLNENEIVEFNANRLLIIAILAQELKNYALAYQSYIKLLKINSGEIFIFQQLEELANIQATNYDLYKTLRATKATGISTKMLRDKRLCFLAKNFGYFSKAKKLTGDMHDYFKNLERISISYMQNNFSLAELYLRNFMIEQRYSNLTYTLRGKIKNETQEVAQLLNTTGFYRSSVIKTLSMKNEKIITESLRFLITSDPTDNYILECFKTVKNGSLPKKDKFFNNVNDKITQRAIALINTNSLTLNIALGICAIEKHKMNEKIQNYFVELINSQKIDLELAVEITDCLGNKYQKLVANSLYLMSKKAKRLKYDNLYKILTFLSQNEKEIVINEYFDNYLADKDFLTNKGLIKQLVMLKKLSNNEENFYIKMNKLVGKNKKLRVKYSKQLTYSKFYFLNQLILQNNLSVETIKRIIEKISLSKEYHQFQFFILDWENLVELIPQQDKEKFINKIILALEKVYQNEIISEHELISNYSSLILLSNKHKFSSTKILINNCFKYLKHYNRHAVHLAHVLQKINLKDHEIGKKFKRLKENLVSQHRLFNGDKIKLKIGK